MGHFRLGTLPDTARWRRVVALIAENAEVAEVAAATTQAALRGLELADGDDGLVQSLRLLAAVVQAARAGDFAEELGRAGVATSAQPDIFEIASGFSIAIDRHLQASGRRTDIGEMAQMAAVESLTHLLSQRSSTVFETGPADVRRAAYELSTKGGFATLAHDFVARFAQRFLTYHLGRELSNHVGGNGRFEDSAAQDDFVEHLGVHCREAAGVMKEYAGDWYSKSNFQGGIDVAKARRFVNRVLKKLGKELQIRGARDA
jgi:hypothetical protein